MAEPSAAPWAALEARIQALEDIEAIKELKARYWRTLDQRKWDELRDTMLPNVVLDMEGIPVCEGPEPFLAICMQAASVPGQFNAHHGHNARIWLTGKDSAEGTWDCWFQGIDATNRTVLTLTNHYADQYVRQGGRWWIKRLEARQTSFSFQNVGPDGAPKYTVLGTPTANAYPDAT